VRLFNHCLGAIAKLNSTLSRYRTGLMPLNVALMLGLTVCCGVLWSSAVDAVSNAQTPLTVSLDQIETNTGVPQNYVRVSGRAVAVMIYKREDDANVQSWFPLVDPEHARALLVRHTGRVERTAPRELTVTGMLRRLHSEARTRLRARDDQFDGIPVNTKVELAEGDSPGNPWRASVSAGLLSMLLACFCAVVFRSNIVFQRGGPLASARVDVPRNQPILVRATGRFAFDEQTAKRFVDVPALVSFELGRPVLMSRIDASEQFMGATVVRRAGIWRMLISQGTVKAGQFGFQFFGSSRRNAFRFSYLDQKDGKSRTCVIAADEPNHLLMAVASLTR